MKITNRYNSTITLCESDVATTLRELAESNKADLRGANLRNANLYNADLRDADLRGANLRNANLRNANLRDADLRDADLRDADLYNADLRNANLYSAKINWNSHALIAEILRKSAGDDTKKRKIAGLVLISTDWCWDKWLDLRRNPLFKWAIESLAKYVTEGDEAPPILVDAKKKMELANG